MPPPEPSDLTPIVGAQTDVAPLGRQTSKPPHEQTAEEERDLANWDGIAAMPEFKALLARKARFIVAGSLFFIVYYFALPVLVGWYPELMNRRIGPINYAYAFALSQFIMAWVVAGIYVKVAAGWDKASREIINKAGGK